MSWVNVHPTAYWVAFVATFFAVAVWESFRPRQPLSGPAEQRWGRHALLLTIAGAVQTLLFRVTPVVVAAGAAGSRFGILNKPWLPFAIRCAAGVLVLDLVEYFVHRAFHGVCVLWKVHEVHHSDPDFDVSTAGRFHPLEVIAGRGTRLAAIAWLAPPLAAVAITELLTVVLNLFSHANARLPGAVEKLVRIVFVTPDLHRIHHSEDYNDQQRNFGQTFSLWDRLFGTYLDTPAAGESGMVTGIKGADRARTLRLWCMLAQPFQLKSR